MPYSCRTAPLNPVGERPASWWRNNFIPRAIERQNHCFSGSKTPVFRRLLDLERDFRPKHDSNPLNYGQSTLDCPGFIPCRRVRARTEGSKPLFSAYCVLRTRIASFRAMRRRYADAASPVASAANLIVAHSSSDMRKLRSGCWVWRLNEKTRNRLAAKPGPVQSGESPECPACNSILNGSPQQGRANHGMSKLKINLPQERFHKVLYPTISLRYVQKIICH